MLAALPLLAATMTTDPRLIAGVTAWGTLPWLLTALPAGAYVDRADARRAMVGVQIVQALLLASLAALTMARTGSIVLLYAIAFGVGVAETVAKVAGQKLVPALVPDEHLERANGRQNAVFFTTHQFIGPPVGALLFTFATALPFWVDAATFAISAALVARIAVETRPRGGQRRPLRGDIVEGLRWLARHRLIRTLSLLSAAANLASFMAVPTLVLFARQRLGLDEIGYGVLVALMAAGGVCGGLLSDRLVARFGGRAVATMTIFTTPAAMICIGLFGSNLPIVATLATVTSFGASLWNVAVGSLRQRTVPVELLGRVSSAGLLVAWGVQPVGAVLGGLVAGWFGLAAPWLVAGAIRLVAATVALPTLRQWDKRRGDVVTHRLPVDNHPDRPQ
ncbi:MFS transporter [Dactylosporangium fulvum]